MVSCLQFVGCYTNVVNKVLIKRTQAQCNGEKASFEFVNALHNLELVGGDVKRLKLLVKEPEHSLFKYIPFSPTEEEHF